MGRFKTIGEATRHWVSAGMNCIPTSVVEKLFRYEEQNDGEVELLSDAPEYHYPAAWGWMWTFDESIDEDWARDNINVLNEIGFTVYDHEDLGIILGIDGAGFDFYEAFWIPLYKARGLQWHEEEVA